MFKINYVVLNKKAIVAVKPKGIKKKKEKKRNSIHLL